MRKSLSILVLLLACWSAGLVDSEQRLVLASPPHPSDRGSEAQNVSLVEHFGGAARAVAAQGDYLYMGAGSELNIWNVAEPGKPILEGSIWLEDVVHDVYVSGQYAYAHTWSELFVIDISEASAPRQVGACEEECYGEKMLVSGDYAYLVQYYGLKVVNLSDPTKPHIVGRFDSPYQREFYDLAVANRTAYLPFEYCHRDCSSGMMVVDVTNPVSPQERGIYWTDDRIYHVAATDEYVYIAYNGFRILDVSDPNRPTEVGQCDKCARGDMTIEDGVGYVVNYDGLSLLDLSTPSNPTPISSLSEAGGSAVTVEEGYSFVVRDGALWVVDVRDLTAPQVVFFKSLLSRIHNIFIVKDLGYFVSSYGIHIMDISASRDIQEVGFFSVGFGVKDLEVVGDFAYIAAGEGGMRIFDIADPHNPVEVGYYEAPTSVEDVIVTGNHAYIADYLTGLRVVNVKDPGNPNEVGFYDAEDNSYHVEVFSGHVYMAGYNNLHVFDVSAPIDPIKVNSYPINGAFDLQIFDGRLFVVEASGSLQIYDLSIPSFPSLKITYLFDETRYLSLTDSYAYITTDSYPSWTISVLDITNPLRPIVAGWYEMPYSVDVGGIAVVDHQAFVAGYYGGLYVLRYASATTTITPEAGGSLTYTDEQGLPTTVLASSDTVTTTTTLVYLKDRYPERLVGQAPANHNFQLNLYVDDVLQSDPVFLQPITVTVAYSDADVAIINDEEALTLQWWSGAEWLDAASTCTPSLPYQHDIARNTLSVPICRAGRYGLFGPTHEAFMPFITR